MNLITKISLLFTAICIFQCSPKEKTEIIDSREYKIGEFGYDLNFLKKHHSDLILLGEDTTGAQLIVLPAYQGRVMTSTASGADGISYGWVNHNLIASGALNEHINVFGGEERFWLGPEGGQFSIYFRKGVPFTFENWFVPKELDTESFNVVRFSKTEARFEKEMHLENYTGNKFDLKVNRNVRLLSRDSLQISLGVDLPSDVQVVGFESENIVTNIGNETWTKDTGMLSIWILSMFNASDGGLVAIPFKKGSDDQLGKIVTDTYFGKIPSDRLKVKDGFMVFKADANYRSKLGISPERAMPWICSYDADKELLTLAQFSLPSQPMEYVNSLWEQQKDPFKGDAVNSYNDGPLENGEQLGKFYEIESSSPAAALKHGESLKHLHRTIHFQGSKASLNQISEKVLSISLSEISLN